MTYTAQTQPAFKADTVIGNLLNNICMRASVILLIIIFCWLFLWKHSGSQTDDNSYLGLGI